MTRSKLTLLYLDIDGPLPRDLDRRIFWMLRLWGWPVEAIRYDKTRHGWHVVIGIRKQMDPVITVAAQAVLGSDRKREAFNLMRVTKLAQHSAYWRGRWNVLFSYHAKGRR